MNSAGQKDASLNVPSIWDSVSSVSEVVENQKMVLDHLKCVVCLGGGKGQLEHSLKETENS
jgi:hypothetical protein